jgi:hypothetical protein
VEPAGVLTGCCVKLIRDPPPATLVKAKLADVVTPDTEATTVYDPTTELAVAVTLERPLISVATVDGDRVADAPEAGALKVTEIPLSGLLKESVTKTWRGVANGASTVVVCGVPPIV